MRNETREQATVDMSPEAIDRRFRMVEALRKLCVSLKEAGEQSRQQETQTAVIPCDRVGGSATARNPR